MSHTMLLGLHSTVGSNTGVLLSRLPLLSLFSEGLQWEP